MLASYEHSLKIFNAPGINKSIEPFKLVKKYINVHPEPIMYSNFSPDGRFVMTCSKDLTVQILNVHKIDNYVPFTFTGHKSYPIKCFFNQNMTYFYTLTKDGYLFVWKWVEDYLTDEYKKLKNYQNFKKGKFFYLGKKIRLEDEHKDIFESDDEEPANEE